MQLTPQMKMGESPLNISPSLDSDSTITHSPPTLYYGRILLGEITPLISAIKKVTPRWSSSQQDKEKDPLVQQLRELQIRVIHLKPDDYLEPRSFLEPFLAVIRSEDTTGPVTKNALAAVNRMLNYGLIDAGHSNADAAVESIATAVTHARFVGTDQGADEVVLWEILTVLRSLMLGPVGHLLTNESVCEILNSSFRICFETRLSELLRNCTEDALRHMVQLLFTRLPQFKDDPEGSKKLKMRTGIGGDSKLGKKSKSSRSTPNLSPDKSPTEVQGDQHQPPCPSHKQKKTHNREESASSPSEIGHSQVIDSNVRDSSEISPVFEVSTSPMKSLPLDISHTHLAPESPDTNDLTPKTDVRREITEGVVVETQKKDQANEGELSEAKEASTNSESPKTVQQETVCLSELKEDYINLQGVKFTQDENTAPNEKSLLPYGLPCVRESFRFLISLTLSTNDQNSSNMIHTALNLLTVALEVGVEHINHIPSLLKLVKNQLCRNLFMLIKVDARPPIFMASLRVCSVLFESLRTHLKFQLEMFINRLTDIVTSESSNVSYAYKELALETIVQLWRIPGLITELFLNFDCNLYSSNVFEDLTRILSKNAFPVQGLYSTNLLSLEALFTAVEIIESHNPPLSKKKKKKSKKEQYSQQEENVSETFTKHPAVVAPVSSGYFLGLGLLCGYSPLTPILKARSCIRGNQDIARESLLAVKVKKKLLMHGTDQFNAKPEKGIQFLQDNGIIGHTYEDIAVFLRDNPHLDKKIIGEYVSKKKNVAILSAFVKSFNFLKLRIDECLRTFLETFRLPGEAPVISIIIEHFSSHWHLSNGEPFEKDDAAFTLAYAVIMLNVDQHNQNAKKQNIPMTLDQFRNNLRGVNDGKDFDPRMLEEIYYAILNEEIVMPAEHTGLVKENYLWKLLLKRGNSRDGDYLLAKESSHFDKDLFAICWGPTIASLSYVFDKSLEDTFVQKAINGFKKCASIAARYGMSDVFDNLVVSLCKFTTLTLSTNESPEHVSIAFGANAKAQLATKTVFRLVILHGDILRDGWKNILELLLQLFRCRLLPTPLVESEDFVEPSGRVSLMRVVPTNIPRVESGLLSSLYSYIALGDAGASRGVTPEDMELIECAKACIADCHPEKLITESAFLRYDSLCELLKSVMGAGDANNMSELSAVSPPVIKPQGLPQEPASGLDEYGQSFLLELVVSVLVANKDRAGGVWPSIRDHIYSLLMGSVAVEKQFLLERCIVSILKVAKVLLRRPELANPILQSLRMLLLLRSHVLNKAALQVVSGIYEVLSVNADHIRDPNDWAILFALLECCGAGAKPPPIVNANRPIEESPIDQACESDAVQSGVDSGHFTETGSLGLSDDEQGIPGPQVDLTGPLNPLRRQTSLPDVLPEKLGPSNPKPSRGQSPESIQSAGGWILVGREGEIEPVPVKPISFNEYDIVHQRIFEDHKPEALVKAVDTLSFLVRERHITATSLPSVVQACRTFVEATLNGVKLSEKRISSRENLKSPTGRKSHGGRKRDDKSVTKRTKSHRDASSATTDYDADESDAEDIPISYQQVSEKLLDLMDTLHTSSSHILNLTPDEESKCPNLPENYSVSLWHQALCPLLQGIARYCCDTRSIIRNLAMTYLQRALLNHDLQTLSAAEWEGCFNKVLFPLLSKLLQPLPQGPSNGAMEETRVRAATLVQKVYLRHLTSLLCLPTFTALWLTILDFMDKYLNVHKSDHLNDAIPEILKNMLLVMETTQVFHTSEGFTHLWSITWDRIDAFLPTFRQDLFKSHPPSEIHRIEVIPSASTEVVGVTPPDPKQETYLSGASSDGETKDRGLSSDPALSSGPEMTDNLPERDEDGNDYVPRSLREQAAVRLSLSHEDLPNSLGSNVILSPPLPYIIPVSGSGSPVPSSSLSTSHNLSVEPATLINQDLGSSFVSLSLFSPDDNTISTTSPPMPFLYQPECSITPVDMPPCFTQEQQSIPQVQDTSHFTPIVPPESYSQPSHYIDFEPTSTVPPLNEESNNIGAGSMTSVVYTIAAPISFGANNSTMVNQSLGHSQIAFDSLPQDGHSITPQSFETTLPHYLHSKLLSEQSLGQIRLPEMQQGCSASATTQLRPASLLFSQSTSDDFLGSNLAAADSLP